MHGMEGQKSSGEDIGSQEQNAESNEVNRDSETNVNIVASTTETKETVNPPHDNGSLVGEIDGQNLQNGYSNAQSTEDYNHLLSQYYEVEEQRQKILNQLYQYGSWDYGGNDASMEWGTDSASQEHQVPAQASCPIDTIEQKDGTASQELQVVKPQAGCPAVAHSCYSCMCPCMLGPCTSLPACTLSGTCVGEFGHTTSVAGHNGNSSSVEKDDLLNTAMGAADRALFALKAKASGDANTSKDEETKLETDKGKLAQSCSSKTDLTVVLNAWYSAGFYTCKYLMEQSAAKERQS